MSQIKNLKTVYFYYVVYNNNNTPVCLYKLKQNNKKSKKIVISGALPSSMDNYSTQLITDNPSSFIITELMDVIKSPRSVSDLIQNKKHAIRYTSEEKQVMQQRAENMFANDLPLRYIADQLQTSLATVQRLLS